MEEKSSDLYFYSSGREWKKTKSYRFAQIEIIVKKNEVDVCFFGVEQDELLCADQIIKLAKLLEKIIKKNAKGK